MIVDTEPSSPSAYEAAPLEEPTPARETSRWPLLSKSNPKGVEPGATSNDLRSESRPSAPTRKVSIFWELRPVTTSTSPLGENLTCAASVAPAFRKRVEPAIGVRPSFPIVKPLTVASAALFLLRT